MSWWLWVIIVVAVLTVLTAAVVWVQARRRSGSVITVRRGHRGGKGGVR
ncbi:hypothetical protein ACFYNO_31045 [Kitasatospora sp. NPDC006697]